MYIRLFLTVRISFLTLLVITSNKKMPKATLYCLSVWNVVKDHLASSVPQPWLLPESECKGRAFF